MVFYVLRSTKLVMQTFQSSRTRRFREELLRQSPEIENAPYIISGAYRPISGNHSNCGGGGSSGGGSSGGGGGNCSGGGSNSSGGSRATSKGSVEYVGLFGKDVPRYNNQ